MQLTFLRKFEHHVSETNEINHTKQKHITLASWCINFNFQEASDSELNS